jgi:peptidoglycan/xylan/chitin deacetylase (PgdA/CDA1 family)
VAAVLAPFAATAAVHIVPAVTWLPRFRAVCCPHLAGRGRPDHIALTFDDGPDPESTPYFLDTLDRLEVRATFFVLGESAARFPDLTRHITDRGHELAVHGWTHRRPWLPAPGRDLRETGWALRAVHDITGRRPMWYRPPYGILTAGRWAAARRLGLRPVLWTAWGRDWRADATPASVRASVGADLRGGGTILLHDSDRAAAPRLLARGARRAAGPDRRVPRRGPAGGAPVRTRGGPGRPAVTRRARTAPHAGQDPPVQPAPD